jgi:prevent-host-death family protein
MTTTLPLAEVRDRLSPLVSAIEDTHERVVITKNGRPVAVIMALSDLESLEETLDVLSDGDTVAALTEALSETETVTLDQVREELQNRILAERADAA